MEHVLGYLYVRHCTNYGGIKKSHEFVRVQSNLLGGTSSAREEIMNTQIRKILPIHAKGLAFRSF